MIKTQIDLVTITNGDDYGYCVVRKSSEGTGCWLEILGNEEKPEYPLALETEEDVDQLCNALKELLK